LEIDFNNPFQGRKWLKLINCEDNYKLSFKPNLLINKKQLGFSFKTNKLGFRGSDLNSKEDNLILGTSFAMGMSVNNGENWYEYFEGIKFFNLAMACGIVSQYDYFLKYYKGNYKNFIYVYHPNVWQFTKDQQLSIDKKINIFKMKNWKTDFYSCFKLYPKYLLKRYIFYEKIKHHKDNYRVIPNYSFFKTSGQNINYADTHLAYLKKISKNFENVYIIRVPVKEQLYYNNNDLVKNYDFWWNYLKNNKLEKYNLIDFSKEFKMNHYHKYDTHWNLNGNLHFSELLKNTIQF
jgi:hypothetical protein